MLTVSIGIWAKYRGRLFSHCLGCGQSSNAFFDGMVSNRASWKVYKSRSQNAGTRVKDAASHTNAIFVLFVTAALVSWAPILTTMSLVRVGGHVSEVVSEYIVIMMLPLKALVNPLQYTVRTMKR